MLLTTSTGLTTAGALASLERGRLDTVTVGVARRGGAEGRRQPVVDSGQHRKPQPPGRPWLAGERGQEARCGPRSASRPRPRRGDMLGRRTERRRAESRGSGATRHCTTRLRVPAGSTLWKTAAHSDDDTLDPVDRHGVRCPVVELRRFTGCLRDRARSRPPARRTRCRPCRGARRSAPAGTRRTAAPTASRSR